MNEDTLPRVHAADEETPDVATVPRGGGAPISDDRDLQAEHIAPEGDLRVTHTSAARAAEQGVSPYPHVEDPPSGLAPDRPNRSTLDNSDDTPADNRY